MSDSKKSLRELWVDNLRGNSRRLMDYENDLKLMKQNFPQNFPKIHESNSNNCQYFPNEQHFQNYRNDQNYDYNPDFNNFDYGPHQHQNSFEPKYNSDEHHYGYENQFGNSFDNRNDLGYYTKFFRNDQYYQDYNPYQHPENNQNCDFSSNFNNFGYEPDFHNQGNFQHQFNFHGNSNEN